MIDKYLEIKSISPEYWGKSGWIFLNSIALTYKPEYKEIYKNFIIQLPVILPCLKCGENLKKNMDYLDQALINKENLINWFIKIRNDIYEENNTPSKKKNIEQTLNEIFYNYNNNNTNYYLYIWVVVSIIILILLIYLFKIKYFK